MNGRTATWNHSLKNEAWQNSLLYVFVGYFKDWPCIKPGQKTNKQTNKQTNKKQTNKNKQKKHTNKQRKTNKQTNNQKTNIKNKQTKTIKQQIENKQIKNNQKSNKQKIIAIDVIFLYILQWIIIKNQSKCEKNLTYYIWSNNQNKVAPKTVCIQTFLYAQVAQ